MAKRKYAYFIVATEFENCQFNDYRSALSEYHRSDSATLYGYDEQNEPSVIFSK